MFLSGCTQMARENAVDVANNPVAAAVDKHVGRFKAPGGQFFVLVNRLNGQVMIHKRLSGQYIKIPKLRHPSVAKKVVSPKETVVALRGHTAKCAHQTVIMGIDKRMEQWGRVNSCAPFHFKTDGSGITAIQADAADPAVYSYIDMHLTGPERMSQIDPGYRRHRARHHVRRPHRQAHHITTHHVASHASAPVVPAKAAATPVPKRAPTPYLNLGSK